MLILVAYILIAGILGLSAFGLIAVLRALFTSADRPDGQRDRVSEGFLPRVPV
jgi:hypothetical protein